MQPIAMSAHFRPSLGPEACIATHHTRHQVASWLKRWKRGWKRRGAVLAWQRGLGTMASLIGAAWAATRCLWDLRLQTRQAKRLSAQYVTNIRGFACWPNRPLLQWTSFAPQAVYLPIILLAWVCSGWAQPKPTLRLTIDGHVLLAELARTPNERMRGLMQRNFLPNNHGMLFVFEAPQRVCMWMKDTPLPLSVAFFDARGVVLNIADMQPLSLEPHCAAGDALYALEMAQGWFSSRRVRPGSRILGLEQLKP